jgi:8-oxo-dGTP pyrophosphatase MutT (NUDIX family)
MTQAIEILQREFSRPLPGKRAQKRMSPSVHFTSSRVPSSQLAKESSVFILLFKGDGHWYIPLIKRPSYKGAHSGQISLPGGKKEPEDIDLLHTAYRETEEEIGIEKDKITHLGTLTKLYIPNSNFNVLPQVGILNATPVFKPDSREVEELIHLPLTQLFENSHIHRFTKTINKIEVSAPFYKVDEHQIWGATAMILSEFSALVESSGLLSLNPI